MEASDETAKETPETPKVRSGHRVIVATLLVVGTLLTFVSVFSIWINRQAFNTDYWVSTSGKLLENEDVQQQLSTFLAAQLFANVDVQSELQKALPPRLAPLAGPAAGGLEQLAPQVAQRALQTSAIQNLWATANRTAHENLLQVVDGGTTSLSTSGGEVKLDLSNIVSQLGSQLGVGGALVSKLPADAGQITILKSDQLSSIQSIAQAVRKLPIVLTVLLILLFGGAIALAGPRRREALRGVGIGFIVAGVLALILRSLIGSHVVDALSSTESVRPAAQATWDIGTSLLVTVATSALAFGILVVIGAWLAGPTRWAIWLRSEAAPHIRGHAALAFGVAGAVYLALIAWAPIAAFRRPFGLLFFLVLMAVGAELMRRQVLREFPEGGGGLAPSRGISGRRLRKLQQLTALHQSGGLSDAEFNAAKSDLLGKT